MEMSEGEKIRTEEDPYLREFMAAGYMGFRLERQTREITFYGKDKSKTFHQSDLANIIGKLTLKKAVVLGGGFHTWISEADGSAQRFRDFING